MKKSYKKVLVIAPHPDDETLGCGGTLLKHKANGDKIYWLIATGIKEKRGFDKEAILKRDKEIKLVAEGYGFDGIYELEIPATQADKVSRDKIIKKMAEVFKQVKPEILYLPFMEDVHSDHRVIFEAACSCAKTFRHPFIQKIMMMEIVSETEFAPALKDTAFVPNYFVDISAFLDKKLSIMKIYKDQISKHPFPRSIKALKSLSAFRGAMAGCKYAESFMILKEIWS